MMLNLHDFNKQDLEKLKNKTEKKTEVKKKTVVKISTHKRHTKKKWLKPQQASNSIVRRNLWLQILHFCNFFVDWQNGQTNCL